MSHKINVPKMLESTADDGKLAKASAIFDEEENKFQSELNAVSIKGVMKVIVLENNTVAAEEPDENTQIDVIYVNNDSERSFNVGISNTHYRTPDGNLIILTVPPGGYGEVNFLNIGGTIYVRAV